MGKIVESILHAVLYSCCQFDCCFKFDRTKTEEVEEAIRQKQQQVKNSEMAVKE